MVPDTDTETNRQTDRQRTEDRQVVVPVDFFSLLMKVSMDWSADITHHINYSSDITQRQGSHQYVMLQLLTTTFMRDPIKRAVFLLKQYFNSSSCLTPAPTISDTYKLQYYTSSMHLLNTTDWGFLTQCLT